MTLGEQIARARNGDGAGFGELTRRYQNLAFGCAPSLPGDFHLAEDVNQDAFVTAYFSLAQLRDPAAFPGWLRQLVRSRAHRLLRQQHLQCVPLEAATEVGCDEWQPDRCFEEKERAAAVLAAIGALPQSQREVVTLFYLQERSQREVAAFLGVPVTAVNNRLHAARITLKRRMLAMLEDTMRENALREPFATHVGRIVAARGPVLEVQFDPGELPEVLSTLTRGDEPRAMTVEVARHAANGRVRCVAVTRGERLLRGSELVNSRQPARESLDDTAVERAVGLLAGSRAEAKPEILETGIKPIDLLCPSVRGGKVGIFGPKGVGTLVLIEEPMQCFAQLEGEVSLFRLVPAEDATTISEYRNQDPEGYRRLFADPAATSAVQTFYLLSDRSIDPEYAVATGAFDAVTYCSREVAAMKIWPAIDPLASTSRFLEPAIVGEEHCRVAYGLRELLRCARELAAAHPGLEEFSEEGSRLIARARRVRNFLSHPFFVAEPYTKVPPRWVSREETVHGFAELLAGKYDDVAEEAFCMVGTVEEALEKARATPG